MLKSRYIKKNRPFSGGRSFGLLVSAIWLPVWTVNNLVCITPKQILHYLVRYRYPSRYGIILTYPHTKVVAVGTTFARLESVKIGQIFGSFGRSLFVSHSLQHSSKLIFINKFLHLANLLFITSCKMYFFIKYKITINEKIILYKFAVKIYKILQGIRLGVLIFTV